MAKYESNGGQTFVTPTPIVNSTSLVATYPQTYTVLQQHQQPPAPGKYDASFSKKSAISLGVFLVVCGAISEIGAAIALKFVAGFHEIALGLWAGNMAVAAGAVAIAAGHHGTKKLITGTAVTSGLAAAAAIVQIVLASYGLAGDVIEYRYDCRFYCYPSDVSCICNYEGWMEYAIAANSMMIGAGSLALISASWLFIVSCIALCRKSTSLQVHALIPVQCVHEVAVSNTIDPNTSSQVQCLHQQDYKSSMPLNHPPSNTTSSPKSSQVHEHHEAPRDDDHDVEKL